MWCHIICNINTVMHTFAFGVYNDKWIVRMMMAATAWHRKHTTNGTTSFQETTIDNVSASKRIHIKRFYPLIFIAIELDDSLCFLSIHDIHDIHHESPQFSHNIEMFALNTIEHILSLAKIHKILAHIFLCVNDKRLASNHGLIDQTFTVLL